MNDSPILIGSAPSSGSTLLSVLLDAHPEVTCGPELAVLAHPGMYARPWEEFRAEFLDNLRPWAWDTQDAADRLRAGSARTHWPTWTTCRTTGSTWTDCGPWPGRRTARTTSSPACTARCGPRRARSGGPRRAHRTCTRSRPSSPGSPPAASCTWSGTGSTSWPACSSGFGLKRAVAVWLVETLLCERLRDHPRACRVEYEELAARPRETVARVLEFLELAPEADAVLAAAAASPRLGADATARGVATWRNRPGGPITTQSVGRWRDGLGESTLAVCLSARVVADPRA